ncbi:acetoin dehydrogenase dihydrolipoyllysine-residue acetyltransferase subunit [Gluconacetobacter entanii]|uniref:Acetoin dehydrogenase dihydrolipoyllysine-residue acetyltransferase subunit n=1 Tax=Gluconacetobacter entanii TaxID=108528 RepID=A0A318PT54_9PROT|nr:acetoin dehydrogenase dihydrolipoyllysine-residue acetyltransferase subunit [Gluconacetobacter entanii]MCE2578480.1 acetoin dehydrogenase dihydrolipoyllysine-residue acetyltransferase subunit [Komagataeibacter sp. FNDCR1]PYD61965.1 acetoin dehydrogenase dihydrolipoyllysine-residue acetyltransferase subunit [Gluconacetobacter entanii]
MASEITPITMPKFGLAMTEGKVAGWMIAPGRPVKAGDELVDIETSKITNAFESPASGILRRQVAPNGETLPVGALIGVVADASVPDAEIDEFITRFQAEFAESNASAKGEETAVEPTLVTVGTHTLRVHDLGMGDATPLVLIHGFGGDLKNWMLNHAALAHGRRVIAFDLPGHGGSSKDVGPGTLSFFADVTVQLLEHFDLPKVHVMGHSLGGGIALTLAQAAPQRVASLCLLAPAGLGPQVNMAFINGFIEADRTRALQDVLKFLVHDKSLIGRRMTDDVLRYKRLDGAQAALQTVAAACFPDGRQGDDLRPVLDAAPCPVTLLWGEEDEILPVTQADGLSASIARHVFSAIGHMPQLECASDVNGIVETFLTQHDH